MDAVLAVLFGVGEWRGYGGWSLFTSGQQFVLFTIVIAIAMEILSWATIIILEWKPRKRIPPGGRPLDERTFADVFSVFTSKALTIVFVYHMIHFCWLNPTRVAWGFDKLTPLNTVVALVADYVVFDFFYWTWHWLLHMRAIYPYIHKHHHRQVVPTRGEDDAIAVMIPEFLIGEYTHLLTILIVPNHIITILAFVIFGGILASLNHTRYDIVFLNGVYSVKYHDTHHRIPMSNYAQYTMLWDWIFGTYVPWEAPKERPKTRRGTASLKVTQAECNAEKSRVLASKKSGSIENGSIVVVSKNNNNDGFVSALVSSLLERGSSQVFVVFNGKPSSSFPANSRVKVGNSIADAKDLAPKSTLFFVGNLSAALEESSAVSAAECDALISACRGGGVTRVVAILPCNAAAGLKRHDVAKFVSANDSTLSTVVIHPSNLYGDGKESLVRLLVERAVKGSLRIMGGGHNLISFTHFDNLSHAAILAAEGLFERKSNVCGAVFDISDGDVVDLWTELNNISAHPGNMQMVDKYHLSLLVLVPLSRFIALQSLVCGSCDSSKLFSPSSIRQLTMTNIVTASAAASALGYSPIYASDEGVASLFAPKLQ